MRTYRTVIGTYRNPDNTPKRGYVEFTPTSELIETPGAKIGATAIVANLVNGVFSIDLIITDNPTIQPEGWKWIVDEKMQGGQMWYLDVPDSTEPLDISTVQVLNTNGAAVYGVTGPQGPAGPGVTLVVLDQAEAVPINTPDGAVILRKP